MHADITKLPKCMFLCEKIKRNSLPAKRRVLQSTTVTVLSVSTVSAKMIAGGYTVCNCYYLVKNSN